MIFVGFVKGGLKLNIPTLFKNQGKLNLILYLFILILKITDQLWWKIKMDIFKFTKCVHLILWLDISSLIPYKE